MTEKKISRRRQVVINRPLQSRIILTISWPPAIALAICALILGIFCSRLVDEALIARVELPSVTPVFVTVVSFMVIATLYLFFNALQLSHRIAGPMYRLNKTFEAVRGGDLKVRANLRKGDFLAEVADNVNEFLDWLEEHPPTGVELVDREAAEAEASSEAPASVDDVAPATDAAAPETAEAETPETASQP